MKLTRIEKENRYQFQTLFSGPDFVPSPDSICLGAIEGQTPCGVLIFSVAESTADVAWLFVDPDYRREGVAHSLLEQAMKLIEGTSVMAVIANFSDEREDLSEFFEAEEFGVFEGEKAYALTLEECLKAPNVIRARMTRYNLTCRTKSELLKEEQVELSKLLNGEIGTDCYQYSCTPELSFVCYDQNQIRGCLLLKELEKNRMQIDIYVNIGGEATIVTLMRSLFDTLEKSGREDVVLQFVAINDDILRALTFLTEIPEDEYRVDSMKYAALAL